MWGNIDLSHIMVWEAKWKELNTGRNKKKEFNLNKQGVRRSVGNC